jgi:hypothetical protein
MSEKIIQISSSDGEIYALTASGRVAFFDKAVGMFVLKSNGEILTFDRANILKHVEEVECVKIGKYGGAAHREEIQPERDLALTIIVLSGLGLLVIGALVYYFTR